MLAFRQLPIELRPIRRVSFGRRALVQVIERINITKRVVEECVSPRMIARWSAGSFGMLSSHHAFASAADGLSFNSGDSSTAALGLMSEEPMRIQIHARLQPARCSGRPFALATM